MNATDFLDATPQPQMAAADFLDAPPPKQSAADFLEMPSASRLPIRGLPDVNPEQAGMVHQPGLMSSGFFPTGGTVGAVTPQNADDAGIIAAMGEAQKQEPMAEHVFDFAKNLATLPATAAVSMATKAAETPAAEVMNLVKNSLDVERGVAPHDTFEPGKPIIPAPGDNEQGIWPAIQRTISGMTTPGSLALLGAAPESDAVKGLFLSGMAGSVPDSLEKMATAKDGKELTDAATELGLNVGMMALLGRHGAPDDTGMMPEQAEANRAAALGSLPAGFVQRYANVIPRDARIVGGGNESGGSEKPVVVSPDLANEIQEALRGNQMAAAPSPAAPAIVPTLGQRAEAEAIAQKLEGLGVPRGESLEAQSASTKPATASSGPSADVVTAENRQTNSTATPAEVKPTQDGPRGPGVAAATPYQAGLTSAARSAVLANIGEPHGGMLNRGLDPSKVVVMTPDGQVDPVLTAIARMRLEGAGTGVGVTKNVAGSDVTTSASEQSPGRSFSDIANDLADKLEGLKVGAVGSGQMHAFGVVPHIWDAAVNVAQHLIRSGGTVADAINEAIFFIRRYQKGFDENAVRGAFSQILTNPKGLSSEVAQEVRRGGAGPVPAEPVTVPSRAQTGGETSPSLPPAAGARRVPDIKSDIATAQGDLQQAIKERPGQGKAGAQRLALATARYRNLREELLSHPDYVAENLSAHNDAITEANAILKPHGMAVRADDFPNPGTLYQKLSPAQLKRFNELSQVVSNTHAELVRMPKKLVSSVHAQMQADGRLPKSPTLTDMGAGRTLDRLTQSLKGKIDSPGLSLADRMAIGKRIADSVTGVKDFATRTMLRAQALWRAGVEGFKHPPVDDDYRAAKKSWIVYDGRTAVENYQYAKALTAKVPQKVRRMAIPIWLEADGDENLLRSQLADVPDRFKEVWQAALKLTPDEKRIALDIKANFDAKLDDAIATGLVEKGRQTYVPQRWQVLPETGESQDPYGEGKKGTAGNPFARLDPRDPFFSFQRETPTYFDGIMAKGVPENLDAAHLVSVYDQAFHKALGSRGWIAALQDATGRDGLPVVKISGKASMANSAEGGKTYFVDSKAHAPGDVAADGRPYRAIDHFALRDWKVAFKDKDGNPIIVNGDMLVHPDYFDDVKNELETPKWTTKGIGGAALKTSAFLKASKFVGPFHIVTEALHSIFHGVSPSVRGFDIDLNDPKQALLSRSMSLGFGAAREMFEDGLANHKGIWAHVPGLGDAVVRMNNFTFNEYIPRLKMKVGLAVMDRNTARYSGKLTPEQIGELTGRQMDAAFGGQNWRLMGTNKSTLAVLRLGFVAPDFLISRAKVIGQAFKPYNREQRVFLIAQAAGVYLLCRAINATFSENHDPHWEPANWDSVVIGKRAYHARFLVSDAANLARDLLGMGNFNQHGIPFISGRLGVVPKIGIETLTGKDLFTGRDEEGLFQTHNPLLKAFSIVAKDTADWMTPMALDGFIRGSAGGQSWPESVMTSLVGVSSRAANPEVPEKHTKR
ncbi:MAG TPA: hypothetical protein VMF08_14125 [Candidatus Sulfotelmatobacter sp.]|nr:hypothetical protein [Candidatus Sulfotelmatobacter sp.]